jgi:hypothetical protein
MESHVSEVLGPDTLCPTTFYIVLWIARAPTRFKLLKTWSRRHVGTRCRKMASKYLLSFCTTACYLPHPAQHQPPFVQYSNTSGPSMSSTPSVRRCRKCNQIGHIGPSPPIHHAEIVIN